MFKKLRPIVVLTGLLIIPLIIGLTSSAFTREPPPPACPEIDLVGVGKLIEAAGLLMCTNDTVVAELHGTCRKQDVVMSVESLVDPGCSTYDSIKAGLASTDLATRLGTLASFEFLFHNVDLPADSPDCFKKTCSDDLKIVNIESVGEIAPGANPPDVTYSAYRVYLQQVCCPDSL